MPSVMQAVHSSHVDRIGHDAATRELHVIWDSGKTSIYEGVPSDLAHDVMTSWSIGSVLTARIKPNFKHRYG